MTIDELLQAATERELTNSEMRSLNRTMAELAGFTVRERKRGKFHPVYNLIHPVSGQSWGSTEFDPESAWKNAPEYTRFMDAAIAHCWLPDFELTGQSGAWTVTVYDPQYDGSRLFKVTTPTVTPALAIVVARLRVERERT